MNMIKKNKNVLIIAGIIIFLTIEFLYLFTDIGRRPKYKEVNLIELTEKINNDESFILYIGSSSCMSCEDFKPTLRKVINNYKITMYYINVHKLSKSENEELLNLINYESRTPKIYFIENGEYSSENMIAGVRDYNYVVEQLEKNNYIKR